MLTDSSAIGRAKSEAPHRGDMAHGVTLAPAGYLAPVRPSNVVGPIGATAPSSDTNSRCGLRVQRTGSRRLMMVRAASAASRNRCPPVAVEEG
jgi:hypothetical protein